MTGFIKRFPLEARSPPRRFCDARMKNAEVDESIGGDKEVAEEAADHVEVPNEDADEGDGKDKDVASQWIIIGAPSGSKDLGFFLS